MSPLKLLKVSPAFCAGMAFLAVIGLTPPEAHASRVMAKVGDMHIVRGGVVTPVVVGTRLRQGDEFISREGAEALVRFDDGARMALRANSTLQLKDLKQKGPLSERMKTIRVIKGSLRYISAKVAQHRYPVVFETNTATIGIRGTDIEIAVAEEPINEEPPGTYLKVNTGLASITAVDGTMVDVDPGQVAFGGEPDLVPKGAGGTKRPAARKIKAIVDLFGKGKLDKLMN